MNFSGYVALQFGSEPKPMGPMNNTYKRIGLTIVKKILFLVIQNDHKMVAAPISKTDRRFLLAF